MPELETAIKDSYMNTSGIGERIKELRGNASMLEFSKKHGIHKSTLVRYEKEETSPDANFLADLCRTYGVNPAWILLGELQNKEASGGAEEYHDRWASFRYIHSMILDTFKQNKENERRISHAIYLAYLSEQHKDSLIDVSISVSLSLNRINHVVYCKDKTLIEIAEDLTEDSYKKKYDAYSAISEVLINNDDVFVFCDLSKSKDEDNKGLYRSIIKTICKSPFDTKTPRADVVFLDSPSFLERHWEGLGIYLSTNILNGSSFII